MDFITSSLIVFAILIAVAVAAVSFQPANPLEKWRRLVERYGTNDEPSEAQFTNLPIRFGGERGGLHPLHRFVTFDATIDGYGLWLVCRSSEGQDGSTAIRVPGTHVRPAGRRGRKALFDLYAEPPVRIAVDAEIGSAIIAAAAAGASPSET